MRARSLAIAWAAGFFDGDGNISVVEESRVFLRIMSCHSVAVERFQRIVGTGTIRFSQPRAEYQRVPSFVWCVANNSDAAATLIALRPFLVAKASHVDALEPFLACPHGVDLRDVAARIRQLNHRRYPGSRESLPDEVQRQYRDDHRAVTRQARLRRRGLPTVDELET